MLIDGKLYRRHDMSRVTSIRVQTVNRMLIEGLINIGPGGVVNFSDGDKRLMSATPKQRKAVYDLRCGRADEMSDRMIAQVVRKGLWP